MSQFQEIPDYNKMYNTWSYTSCHPMEPFDPNTENHVANSNHPPLHSPPMSANSNNPSGCGPLDYDHNITSVATSTDNTVNMSPFQAPSNNTEQRNSSGSGGKGHRRSSLGDFFSSMVGVDTSQQVPLRKTVSHSASTNINNSGRRRSSIAKFLMPDSQTNDGGSANLGRRRSSAFTSLGFKTDTGGDEHKGPYAYVSRAQAEHMDRVREAEKNLKLTHNKDGLPLPKENMQAGGRRRSSVAKILGFDKPLLAL